MKLLIAPDKFKGSLSALQVCDALAYGLMKADRSFVIHKLPLADGGDGLYEVLHYYTPFQIKPVSVHDPLFRKINSGYLWSEETKTAFIEMAKASGLHLLRAEEYDCLRTTSFGTGELILAALQDGAQKIILGIGGSATHDIGAGMAAALGFHFYDNKRNEFIPTGGALKQVQSIERPKEAKWQNVSIDVACDVRNVLTGPTGAAYVYAPQKGAEPNRVQELEEGTLHFASVVQRDLGIEILDMQGGGAAGGLGAGCVAFLEARLQRGAELVLRYAEAEKHVQEADLVLTGEGKLDGQTLNGKLVQEITSLARQYGKPVIGICGSLELNTAELDELGLLAAFSIIRGPISLQLASERAWELLADTGWNIGRMLSNK